MLITRILNPQINSLLSRVRHTNMLVITDRGFPFWPMIETINITLIDDIPTVLQVLNAIRPNFVIGEIILACEFREHNSPETVEQFAVAMHALNVTFMPHTDLKQRVPSAIGLIRTGDTTPYANMILISA
ncbi:MAG: RbsD/FucU family protein [Roseiflexaceae bacterium]|nr:RbsD/FucU family protein [Roseiflexaceae bacterium]